MVSKRTPSDLGYIEDRWFANDGTPKARHGQGRRYKARLVDEDGTERSASFASERAAKSHLKSVARGEYANACGQTTFEDYYNQWAERQVWVPGTRQAMNLAPKSVPFATVRLAQLRPSHIEAWVKGMVDKPLEPSTIRTRFNNVRAVIRAAVADRAIPFDPTVKVRLPRVRRAEAAMSIPTPAEVGALLDKAEGPFAALIGLCAFAGLRLGEAAGLKVGDVDFLRKEIRVSRQVQRAGKKQVDVFPPKYGSERTVYAPAGLIDMLAEHVRLFRPGDDPDRWLFLGDGENPMHQNSVNYQWRKTRDAAGVGYRLHDLRHFFASGLISAGCDPVTVQRALGHLNASVTLSTYSHLWPKAEDRTRQAAADMFAASVENAAAPLRPQSR
jgi:integrase